MEDMIHCREATSVAVLKTSENVSEIGIVVDNCIIDIPYGSSP